MKSLTLTLLLTLAAAALSPAASSPEQEVRAAMAAFAKAVLNPDKAALEKLLGDQLLYSHSNASLETKADVIKVIAVDRSTTYKAWEYAPDTKVVINGDTAIVRGNITLTNTPKGEAERTLKLSVLQVWKKQGGGWQMIGRQSTRLP